MLKGKTVLLGVTGGIAAYKAAALASALVKQHACVEVIMTAHATEFIAPLTFEQLTGNRCMVDTFDRNFAHQVEHIALADRTDLVMIAPATANVCGKLAHGLADDMLTTTVLACTCPKVIAPAMNTKMFENPVTQDNLETLRRYGWEVIAPDSGRLACGAVGAGKLPEPEDILQHILRAAALPHDLAGKRVLVTAGPTQEALDPVRYLTNHSTGKMGYALARMAMLRGAQVVLDISSRRMPELLRFKPLLIKPNDEEVREIWGRSLTSLEDVVSTMVLLHGQGARNVLLTLGDKGMLFSDGVGLWYCDAPKVKLVSSACAGDSCLAAFLSEWLGGGELETAMKKGSATGADVAGSNGIGDLLRVSEYMQCLTVRKVR